MWQNPVQEFVITKSEQLSLFEQEQRALPSLTAEEIMQRLCASLLEEAEVTEPPVPVEMVASLRGIATIEEAEQPFAGLLRPGTQGFEVRVRRRDGRERQRFTICHEAGHTLLPGFQEARQFRCNGPRNWLEKMCDTAAAELLLPKSLFEPIISGSRINLATIQHLSDQFEASIEATARRAVSLARRPAMLIALSERHKPAEEGHEGELPPKLRVDYSVSQGDWPFILRHKSASAAGLGRTLEGEIVDEEGSIDELCAAGAGDVRISARRFGRGGRVLALIERAE